LETKKSNIIGITGTHGVGKSYFAFEEALRQKDLNPIAKITLIEEQGILDNPFPINKRAQNESQMWVMCAEMMQHFLNYANKKIDLIITDRTIFDCIPYSMVNGLPFAKALYDITKHFGYMYKKIYILDPRKRKYVFDNGIRSVDKNYRSEVHEKFIELFKRLKNNNYIKHYEVVG